MNLIKSVFNQTLSNIIVDHSEDIIPIFSELFKIITGDLVRNTFTLKEMFEWFENKINEFPNASVGVAILKKDIKPSVITICLLTKEGNPYIYNDQFIGQDITCTELDKEITRLFGNKNIIFFY
jgi:hypothetical protein